MPSTTPSLTSSETITKFLRSKETDVQDILKIANDVLDQKLDVYFPNSRGFVLNLLVDRLNDKSTLSEFGKWKYNKDVWGLLERALTMKTQSLFDETILHNLKIVDLTIIIMERNDPQGWNCLPYIRQILSIFMQKSFIEIDESTGIRLLKSLLNYIQNNTSGGFAISLDTMVINLYWNSSSHGVFDFPKRSYERFFEELFNPLIKYLSITREDPGRHLYEEVFRKNVFNADNLPYLVHNLEKLLKRENIDAGSLKYFFQEAVEKLASKNMGVCAQLFTVIVNKSPELSEVFLALLVNSQHNMPQEFISSVYTKEVASKKFIELNWDMVKYVFELDSELAAMKSKFIFEKYNSAFNINEKVLSVGKVVVSAYSKNRDLVEFLLKVWPKAIEKDELWDSAEFVAHVSYCITSLSEKQVVEVIEASLNLSLEASSTILTSITKGLMMATPKLVNSLQSAFVKIQSLINTQGNFWQVRYNLLNLYGTTFDVPESLLKIDYDLYYHYTVFRMLELNVIKDYPEKQQHQFILFSRDNMGIISSILYRWFVIINDYFSVTNKTELLKIALGTNFLCEIDDEFYEQRNLITSIIRIFIADPLSHFHHITTIPLACYSRGPKRDLLNILTKVYLESKETGALKCINYLLESASYQSSIERDFSILIQVLKHATSEEAKRHAASITNKVWSSNIAMIKSEANRVYVEHALDILLKHLVKDGDTETSPEMEMTLAIVLHSSVLSNDAIQKYEELVRAFKIRCIKQLQGNRSSMDSSNLNWLLHGLANIPKSMLNFDDVSLITQLLHEAQFNDSSTRQAIFKLVCKTGKLNLRFSKYVLSLFLVLNADLSTEPLYGDLVQYLQVLADEHVDTYNALCRYVITSATDTEDHFADSTYMIVCAMLTTISKECDQTVSTALFATYLEAPSHKLSLKVIQSIIINVKWLLMQKPWMFNQYVIEMMLVVIEVVPLNTDNAKKDELEAVYVQSLQALSQMLLHHRYKLSTRHHLVINLTSIFLDQLAESGHLRRSTAAADAFTRMLSTLCEPQEHVRDVSTRTVQQKSRLTTQASLYKKQLRTHLPYLIINYIYLNLRFTFDKQVNDILVGGIYTIFDTLSQKELQIVNSALDYAGKALYKSLYRDYQEYWKWKDQ
ncbi:hypothetical protein CANMA_004073 [Candida margitis]|uniref:uncharacterized protein n=1 Tax=Candida margitis TaxID=1775924 RepID=UPI0022264C8F|nr:uncharacterized protein CANMA_004073 [Candida margitis]KAI5959973.1 hypothetical protein CANMA_004073 [Candida margitis]